MWWDEELPVLYFEGTLPAEDGHWSSRRQGTAPRGSPWQMSRTIAAPLG
jgi:hypothetical protein